MTNAPTTETSQFHRPPKPPSRFQKKISIQEGRYGGMAFDRAITQVWGQPRSGATARQTCYFASFKPGQVKNFTNISTSMKWSRQPPGLGPGHWGLRGWADGQRRALGAGPMAGQVPVTGFFLFAVANRFYASRGQQTFSPTKYLRAIR